MFVFVGDICSWWRVSIAERACASDYVATIYDIIYLLTPNTRQATYFPMTDL